LHEVAFRACFKPALPRFFVEKLTDDGDTVVDPFMGRGTTVLSAVLHNRIGWGCDASPVSHALAAGRLLRSFPSWEQVSDTLDYALGWGPLCPTDKVFEETFSPFFTKGMFSDIYRLRSYLMEHDRPTDRWLRMLVLSRLTGHSSWFLSCRTMPPNSQILPDRQRGLNERAGIAPVDKDIRECLHRKHRSLLRTMSPPKEERIGEAIRRGSRVELGSCTSLQVPRFHLVITSPPFLDVVDYAQENWMRHWFLGQSPREAMEKGTNKGLSLSKLADWRKLMLRSFVHLKNAKEPGGVIAFEAGCVRNDKVDLAAELFSCGIEAGLEPLGVVIHKKDFTKTSHCWGVDNNTKGTNDQRVVLFY